MTADGPMDPWYIYAVPWTPKQYIKILFKYKKNLFDPCQSMQTIEFFKTKGTAAPLGNSAYFRDFDWAVVVGWPLCLVIWCEKCCFCFFLFADVPKTRNILHQGARLLQLSCTKPKAALGGKAFSLVRGLKGRPLKGWPGNNFLPKADSIFFFFVCFSPPPSFL